MGVRRCAASHTRDCGEVEVKGEEDRETSLSLSKAVLLSLELAHCVLLNDLPSPHTRRRRCLEGWSCGFLV